MMPVQERRRDGLLIGGASGTGKTSVSYRVAREHGVGITEFDDVVEALKTMTTPDQQPALHCWDTRPEARSWAPEQIAANLTSREPAGGDMTVRARVSWLFGEDLRAACERVGVPVLSPRPWDTLLERVRTAVS